MLFIIIQTMVFVFFIIGESMLKYLVVLAMICNAAFAGSVKIVLTEENSVVFNQRVGGEYVAKKTLEIMQKSLKASELYLVLDTPGGSVTAGLAFVDAIKSLDIKVHTITLFAASMGYQFVQELGTRYITPSGTLMSHRGAVSGISGQVPGELNSRVNHIQAILNGMSTRASARVGMSKKDYEAAIVNELWVYGEEAVSGKHADALADVKCSQALMKDTYKESIITIFGRASLVFSKCPLISTPIDLQFDKEVKPEHFNKVRESIQSRNKNFKLTF
jgi:ATP-dependent Clp protease protease subunit